MQSTDRDGFNIQIRTLMGAHGEFPAPEKVEAYWIAFGKLSLIQFTRLIEYALSESGPDKMPTVPAMWALWREMRATAVAQPLEGGTPKPVATLAEQLCAYAVLKLALTLSERARAWDYRYREWNEGKLRQVELHAVHIPRDNGVETRITVADMLADREGYARALASFRPGSRPVRNNEVAARLAGIATLPVLEEAAPIAEAAWAKLDPDFGDEPLTW